MKLSDTRTSDRQDSSPPAGCSSECNAAMSFASAVAHCVSAEFLLRIFSANRKISVVGSL
jgi:hypothetical protein